METEIVQSDKLAETLTTLQSLLERYATDLEEIKNDIKTKRDSLRSVFDNDSELCNELEEVKKVQNRVKTRKSVVVASPVVQQLKVTITELNDRKKEIEETISTHLLSYYNLTNSKSFDTSDGDQWEFNIRGKVKSRKK